MEDKEDEEVGNSLEDFDPRRAYKASLVKAPPPSEALEFNLCTVFKAHKSQLDLFHPPPPPSLRVIMDPQHPQDPRDAYPSESTGETTQDQQGQQVSDMLLAMQMQMQTEMLNSSEMQQPLHGQEPPLLPQWMSMNRHGSSASGQQGEGFGSIYGAHGELRDSTTNLVNGELDDDAPESSNRQRTMQREARSPGRNRDRPDRPYACNECNSRFRRNEHLERHMLSHTGERRKFVPWICR